MTLPAKKLREAVLQGLFAYTYEQDLPALTELLMELLSMSKKNVLTALSRAKLVLEKEDILNEHIKEHSSSYDLERISYLEKAILKLAVFEILFDDTIPSKVAIAEAIRLTNKFSTPDGGRFVNGILDAFYKSLSEEKIVS